MLLYSLHPHYFRSTEDINLWSHALLLHTMVDRGRSLVSLTITENELTHPHQQIEGYFVFKYFKDDL